MCYRDSNRIILKFIFILIIGGCIVACHSEKETAKKQKIKLKYPPPGTNFLKDNIFIDEAEVSNMSWGEYMYWIKRVYGADSWQFKSTLPDTLVWKNCYQDFKMRTNQDQTDIESLVYLYLRHPQYNHFPVVGVSYDQAVNFCNWRTNRVNEVLYVEKHK